MGRLILVKDIDMMLDRSGRRAWSEEFFGFFGKGGVVMKRHFWVTFPVTALLSMLLCSAAWADTLSGLSDVTVVDDAIVSLRYEGTEYVVADGDLAVGTTTRWYVDPGTGVETLWEEGGPTAPTTVSGTSNPKDTDVGSKADNFLFRLDGSNDISSIDGIDFQETIFPFLTDTIFVFERNGNDNGTVQAIRADGSLGPALTLTSGGAPYADTGVNVGGQNAFGYVLKTDVPVKGLRITASGHDSLTISAPAGANPTQAHDPQPENGAKDVPVAGTILSWQTGVDPANLDFPNPNIKEHYLWISKPYDPQNPPSGPDWNDPAVQQFTIGADTNPADGSVDPSASKTLGVLQRDSLYYWVVDEGLTGSSGPLETDPAKIIWSTTWFFETVTSGPDADAGSSIVTWLEAGTTTVDLSGTVTDVTGDVTLIRWSVVSSPAGSTVNIANSSVAATTASFTETGRYILELYAKDAVQNEDSDMMEVYVYADSCEAAKNNPSGYVAPMGDLNDDCKVDFEDFAMVAAAWLQDESLTADALYDPGTLSPVVQFTNPVDGSTVSGEVIINAIAYDVAVGTTDGDGMLDAGYVFFEVLDSAGTVLDTQMENVATFDMTWDTTLPLYPNGVYTIRVTAESDAGEQTIDEISVTVNN